MEYKDNPLFEHEKKKDRDYIDSLNQAVEYMKKYHPDKYIKAQQTGEIIMEGNYNLISGMDEDGDRIKADHLLHTIRDYSLDDNDLNNNDKQLLISIYGNNWKQLL